MKELKLYQCEICNTQYNDKTKAKDCEKSHRMLRDAVASKYRAMKANLDGYPDEITATFDDGKEIKYKRG